MIEVPVGWTGRTGTWVPTPVLERVNPFPLDSFTYPTTVDCDVARAMVHGWVELERNGHADEKYDRAGEWYTRMYDAMRAYKPNDDFLAGEWGVFLSSYMKRVEMFGLRTPQGRQAMGKLIVTMLACLEAAVIVYGDMPRLGVPSGEIDMSG